ncbi:MAG TPA: SAVED domain-containing protein, partial [Methylomirabilota bacterium]|nr:SAVED domain-containing protein [Methylomirabilota bacterium]
RKKIEEDLTGAVKHWGDSMKTWVFVYNVRRGVAPDIPRELIAQQNKYPNINIEYIDNDMLWEMARDLPLQQRAEILGAPAGYEFLFLAPEASSKDIQKALKKSRFVIIQDVLSPINLHSVSQALKPSKIFGAPFFIRPVVGNLPWDEQAEFQKRVISDLLQKTWDLSPRYAIFSLAPIPLVLQLGFLLSNRTEVQCYQYHRDKQSWKWQPTEGYDEEIHTKGIPTETQDEEEEVAIRVSLSAAISPKDTEEVIGSPRVQIDITVDNPDVMWLKNQNQLVTLGTVFRGILSQIRKNVPNTKKIHLFYAGPTGGAAVIGQQINPRMDAPVYTYQFSMQASPHYQLALTLREESS